MIITKTCLYNFDPLKPHFYKIKLGFTGVYIIFLISAQKHRLWYSLEPPLRGGSNEYPQSMFWAEIWKISEFFSEIFQFLEVKFSIYLNRRVFVMECIHSNRPEAFLISIRNTPLNDKIRKFPQIFVFFSYRKNFLGTEKRVRIRHGILREHTYSNTFKIKYV